jgi:hypothetical protein
MDQAEREAVRDAAEVAADLLDRPKRRWKPAGVRRVAAALVMTAAALDADRQNTERAERKARMADTNVDRLRQLADRQASTGSPEVRRAAMDMLVALGVPRESVEREYGHVECSITNPLHCPKHGHCACHLSGGAFRNPACPLHGLNNTTHPESSAATTRKYATDHHWTPYVSNPFSKGDSCRVMLARYVCPYTKEEHPPGPPERLDVFGYRWRS